jgi:hypothetical protein
MAQTVATATSLRIYFETGMNEKGDPIYKSKTLSNVKNSATADQLHQAAQAFAALSEYPLNSVQRNDSFDVIG